VFEYVFPLRKFNREVVLLVGRVTQMLLYLFPSRIWREYDEIYGIVLNPP
jgi:hypothetical protein